MKRPRPRQRTRTHPSLRHGVLLMGATFGAIAAAHAGGPAAGVTPKTTGDDIVVTGRALPGSVVGDIPPENRLNPADIAAYGVSTISDLLDAIADQTQSDEGRDSSSAPVVLVNGKRVSGVNEVGDLPTEAVLRIDILPEEVALKYGYDAQRKVVNVILRRRFIARVTNATGGRATDGGGENGAGVLSYVRIHDSDRFSLSAKAAASAALLQSDRGLVSTSAATDPTGAVADDTPFRTLQPDTRSYTLNGTFAHRLSDALTASLNANGAYQTSAARNGLPTATLSVPADSPFARSDDTAAITRFLSSAPLRQHSATATAHGGITLDADLSKDWQLSMIGTLDHSDTRTATDAGYDGSTVQAAIDAGDPTVNPYGPLFAAALGIARRQHASAVADTGSASVVAMGKLFSLPAGPARASLRIGGGFSALSSGSSGAGAASAATLRRSDYNAQASLDVPLTSSKTGFLDAIGTLSANVNLGTTQLSDYGALGTLGYGLNWTPRKGIGVIVAVNEDRVAPTLQQLNAPTIRTANVLVYDYVRGRTVAVTQISGGSATLTADGRHVFKLGLSAAAIAAAKTKLTLSATYIASRTDNAIGSLPTLTAAVEAAFPDRYVRDSAGTLVSVDARAVNYAREARRELRSGLTFSQVLRSPTRPRPPANWAPPPFLLRHRVPRDVPRDGDARSVETRADRATPGADGDDIVVEGHRMRADALPPPDLPPGFAEGDGPPPGPPPDGMEPPPGGFGGPGGPRGPGGFGGPGGPPSGPPGGNGGDTAMRLQVSLFHSWYFRDRIVLRDGGASIDLLDGGSTGTGGQPRHAVQGEAGIVDNGIGLRLSGNWKSATTVTAATTAAGMLRFAALATLDVRLFANLEQRFAGRWARATRVTLAIGNVADARQHVRDATGATPLLYQAAAIDPLGRTISLSLRRLF
ncbi:TonB-dependent receptor [Sphingomonas sp. CARO-RG-8B-R24-01]|uniref:TonB-dependent receptor n=1 Tax=Sphingomonas sp. CARO-RG-8B-R24-01 TaxID=2914831 RepID=UPI001F55B582|nr:TonB-dependent receptor [Sphingomonas sp. CARO-RG-8B-R24-01]